MVVAKDGQLEKTDAVARCRVSLNFVLGLKDELNGGADDSGRCQRRVAFEELDFFAGEFVRFAIQVERAVRPGNMLQDDVIPVPKTNFGGGVHGKRCFGFAPAIGRMDRHFEGRDVIRGTASIFAVPAPARLGALASPLAADLLMP